MYLLSNIYFLAGNVVCGCVTSTREMLQVIECVSLILLLLYKGRLLYIAGSQRVCVCVQLVFRIAA